MTMTQQILARHADVKTVRAGQLLEADLDLVLGNDITAPVAIAELEKAGMNEVFDPNRIVLVLDHFTPNRDKKAAAQCSRVRNFAHKHGISHLYDVGTMGIEHALIPELGLAAPGELILGADSHTCTYGALGALATGVGSTDMAGGMATGQSWFKVPSAIRVRVSGKLTPPTSGKDVILTLIAKLGVDGANYQSLEFTGDLRGLTMDDRLTMANMAVECGAKNGIFEVDEITLAYLEGRVARAFTPALPGADDDYERVIDLNLDEIEPVVACPSLPSNVRRVREMGEVPLQQVVIGSCTNGRIGDLRAAAAVMKGKKVAEGVRCIIIPATQSVYLQALREGLVEIFILAGAAVSTPTCGPCLGGHMGVLDAGEVCVATTNRNFVGRMGHVDSQVYLASPAVAAASAVAGRIAL